MTERRLAQGLGAMRASPEAERTDAAMATLGQAIASAQAGDHQRGRELCASVLFEIQPLLARRKALLRATVLALLVSQGFKLLTRVVVALSGQSIRVVLKLDSSGQMVPPRCHEEPQETIYTIDPRWLTRLTDEDAFLRGWCDALARGQASYGGRTVPSRARLSPEHV
jgi:hypothetical protein